MQIIGHENDIVDHLGNLLNGEVLQIPVRSRCRNRDCLVREQALQNGKECQVVRTVIRRCRRNAWNIWSLNKTVWNQFNKRRGVIGTYPRVLPVNVNTIEIILKDKIGHVCRHGVRIIRRHTFAEDHISGWIR